MGRENMTRAQHKMNQVLDNQCILTNPILTFQEIDSYLDRLEHQVNSSYYRNTIDSRIAQLEKQIAHNIKKEETSSIS